jgi:hypothetical protein
MTNIPYTAPGEQGKWISVKDRLPKKGEWPVVCETRYFSCPGKQFFEIADGKLIGSSGKTLPGGTVKWKSVDPVPLEVSA